MWPACSKELRRWLRVTKNPEAAGPPVAGGGLNLQMPKSGVGKGLDTLAPLCQELHYKDERSFRHWQFYGQTLA
jgi:hypothetical protein